MWLDPYKLKAHHESVALRIQAEEPGLAQSVIGDTLVSYDATGWPTVFTGAPNDRAQGPGHGGGSMLEELLLDIAHGDGIASPKTFSRRMLDWLIEDRRRWPRRFSKKHREADDLERLVLTRPQIFY